MIATRSMVPQNGDTGLGMRGYSGKAKMREAAGEINSGALMLAQTQMHSGDSVTLSNNPDSPQGQELTMKSNSPLGWLGSALDRFFHPKDAVAPGG